MSRARCGMGTSAHVEAVQTLTAGSELAACELSKHVRCCR